MEALKMPKGTHFWCVYFNGIYREAGYQNAALLPFPPPQTLSLSLSVSVMLLTRFKWNIVKPTVPKFCSFIPFCFRFVASMHALFYIGNYIITSLLFILFCVKENWSDFFVIFQHIATVWIVWMVYFLSDIVHVAFNTLVNILITFTSSSTMHSWLIVPIITESLSMAPFFVCLSSIWRTPTGSTFD